MADIYAPDLTLTVTEMQSSNRWYYERLKLKQKFPNFELVGSNNVITAAIGVLTTQFNNTYAVRIELNNYPHQKPTIRPRDWTIHPSSPHKFNDGSICVMRSDQWRSHYTIALIVAKAAVWLGKYELWKREGTWPGLGQQH